MSLSEDDNNLTIQTPSLIAEYQCNNNSSLPENINKENLLFSDDMEINNSFEDYSQNTDSSSESLSSFIDPVKDISQMNFVSNNFAKLLQLPRHKTMVPVSGIGADTVSLLYIC
jgi:hypothetical protein